MGHSVNMIIFRYFLAYGGKILKPEKAEEATHVFHSRNQVKEVNEMWPKNCKHLQINWVVDCVNNQNLVPSEKYLVKWKPAYNDVQAMKHNELFDKL